MDEKRIPIKKETTNDRHVHSSLLAEEEPERRREDAFHHADDGDELPFDVPRD